MESNWKTYKGFSRYSISSNGTVWDNKLDVAVSRTPNEDGYLKVTLRSDLNKRKGFSVHRLVALLFLDNPNNLPEVNHKNGIKKDCSVDNLEWMTHSDNIQHAWDTGLIKNTEQRVRKIREANSYKFKKVMCINTGEEFDSVSDAAKFYGGARSNLWAVLNGKGKTFCVHPVTKEKLKWKYVNE